MRLHTPRITGSLEVSSSVLSIDGAGTISGSSISTGSFGTVQIGGKQVYGDASGIGIGISDPADILHLSDGTSETRVQIENTGTGDPILMLQTDGLKNWYMGIDRSDSHKLHWHNTGGAWDPDNAQMDLSLEGDLTLSGSFESQFGNISGSSSSTGSFGAVNVAGMTVPNLINVSSSVSSRVNLLEGSGSITESSASFSTRVTTTEASGALFDGTGAVTFATVDTGQGANELYDMDQNVLTTSSPTFVNITATGIVTAEEFHTEFVSASIAYVSGSTKFGDTSDDVHSFTGSVHLVNSGSVSGSIFSTGSFGAIYAGGMTVPNLVDVSSSVSTRVTDLNLSLSGSTTLISGSATSTGSFGSVIGVGNSNSFGTTNFTENIVIAQGKKIQETDGNAYISFDSGYHITGSSAGDIVFDIDNNANETDSIFRITANNQATELMRVNESGNVGIGIAPNNVNKLQIKQASDINLGVRGAEDVSGAVCIQAVNDVVDTNIPLEYRASKHCFPIGNVGIGIAAPQQPLHIHQASAGSTSYAQFTQDGTGATSGDGLLVGVNAAETAIIYNAENTALKFYTNTVERMEIQAGGIIGTTSGSAQAGGISIKGGQVTYSSLGIHTGGTCTYTPTGGNAVNSAITIDFPNANDSVGGIRFRSHGGMEGFFGYAQDGSAGQGDFVFQGYNGSAYAELMRINQEGSVGIGTTAPVTSLDVHSVGTEVAAAFGMADDGTAWVTTRTGETQNNYGAYGFMVGSAAIDGVGSTNCTAYIASTVENSGGTLQGSLKFYTNQGDSLQKRVQFYNGGEIDMSFHGDTSSGGTAALINSSGRMGTTTSLREVKGNIKKIDINATALMNKFEPVTFNYKKWDTKTGKYLDELEDSFEAGMIVNDTQDFGKDFNMYDEGGKVIGIRYQLLTPYLIKAVQELSSQVTELKKEIEELKS